MELRRILAPEAGHPALSTIWQGPGGVARCRTTTRSTLSRSG
jgi:hypothetical protein